MIRFLAIVFVVLTGLSAIADAKADPYMMTGATFPDETSEQGLPYAIPCVRKTMFNGTEGIKCTWMYYSRNITVWDSREDRYVEWANQIVGRCINGTCREAQHYVGSWNENVPYVLSLWYYIGESTDGKPVAYRVDGGPLKGGKPVSYVEAGGYLWSFYTDHGMAESQYPVVFDRVYEGGIQQFRADALAMEEPKPAKQVKVLRAWCNPRLDDDCYINDNKVPVAQLSDYLPKVTQEEVDSAGGYCEYPVCYDAGDNPIGIM